MRPVLFLRILTIILLQGFITFGQDTPSKFYLSAGGSIPEMFNLGGKIRYNNHGRLDFKLGTNFNLNNLVYTGTLNHCWYFGPVNKTTDKKIWGLNTGYTLLYEQNENLEEYVSFLNIFFSREFKISEKVFIEPELGASFRIHTYVKHGYSSGYNIPVIPKIGVNLFYNL